MADPSKTCDFPNLTNECQAVIEQSASRAQIGKRSLSDPEVRRAMDERAKAAIEADAARERLAAMRTAWNCVPERFKQKRPDLDSFEVYHPAQRGAVDRLRQFAQTLPERVAAGEGLLLYGTVGTGKDHLLAAMLFLAARAGLSFDWVNGMDLYGRLRDRMKADQTEEEELQRLSRPAVLVLSDPLPPVGELTQWRLEFLYRLVNRRYDAVKSTFVSLNARDTEDADQKLGQQVFDRLQETAEIIPCFWPSFRNREQRKRSGKRQGQLNAS